MQPAPPRDPTELTDPRSLLSLQVDAVVVGSGRGDAWPASRRLRWRCGGDALGPEVEEFVVLLGESVASREAQRVRASCLMAPVSSGHLHHMINGSTSSAALLARRVGDFTIAGVSIHRRCSASVMMSAASVSSGSGVPAATMARLRWRPRVIGT